MGGADGWRLQRWKDIKSKAFKVKAEEDEGGCKRLEVNLFLAASGTKAKSIWVSMKIYIRVEFNLNLNLIMLITT